MLTAPTNLMKITMMMQDPMQMCFFARSISQLENKERKNSIAKLSQNPAKPIEKVHICSKNKKKERKNKSLKRERKAKAIFFVFFF